MRIMIDLPDEIHAWLTNGKQHPGPLNVDRTGLQLASQVIETGVYQPMTCETCALSTVNYDGEQYDCHRLGRNVEPDWFCADWEARP